ncbi:MAG: ABC transporter ATP-binding protein [Actinomycetaceae bacterium]
MSAPATGLLDVRGLRISAGEREIVTGIDLHVDPGECLGLVGESGSGKSLAVRAVMDILPRGVRRSGGEVTAGGRFAMVFQNPTTSLDPLMSVGNQIAEVRRFVRGRSRAEAKAEAIELLTQVGIPDPATRYRSRPDQLSGGQRQRVGIAIALATDPDILLCDEPTTALDVTVQAQVLGLLTALRRDRGLTMVMISHDLAVVAQVADRVAVMRAGAVVETGPTASVVGDPQHEYTASLVGAVLDLPEAEDS